MKPGRVLGRLAMCAPFRSNAGFRQQGCEHEQAPSSIHAAVRPPAHRNGTRQPLLVVALAQPAAQVIVTPDDDPHQAATGPEPADAACEAPADDGQPQRPVLPGRGPGPVAPRRRPASATAPRRSSFLAGAKAGRSAQQERLALPDLRYADQKGPSGAAAAMVLMPNLNLASIRRSPRMQPDQRNPHRLRPGLLLRGRELPCSRPRRRSWNRSARWAPKPAAENPKPAEIPSPPRATNPRAAPTNPATAAPVSAATSDSVPPATAATPEAGATPGEPAIEEIIERLDKAVGAAPTCRPAQTLRRREQAALGSDGSPRRRACRAGT